MAPILALRIRNYFIIRIIFRWKPTPLSVLGSQLSICFIFRLRPDLRPPAHPPHIYHILFPFSIPPHSR